MGFGEDYKGDELEGSAKAAEYFKEKIKFGAEGVVLGGGLTAALPVAGTVGLKYGLIPAGKTVAYAGGKAMRAIDYTVFNPLSKIIGSETVGGGAKTTMEFLGNQSTKLRQKLNIPDPKDWKFYSTDMNAPFKEKLLKRLDNYKNAFKSDGPLSISQADELRKVEGLVQTDEKGLIKIMNQIDNQFKEIAKGADVMELPKYLQTKSLKYPKPITAVDDQMYLRNNDILYDYENDQIIIASDDPSFRIVAASPDQLTGQEPMLTPTGYAHFSDWAVTNEYLAVVGVEGDIDLFPLHDLSASYSVVDLITSAPEYRGLSSNEQGDLFVTAVDEQDYSVHLSYYRHGNRRVFNSDQIKIAPTGSAPIATALSHNRSIIAYEVDQQVLVKRVQFGDCRARLGELDLNPECGDHVLSIDELCPPDEDNSDMGCGNRILDQFEECDDGNTIDGDGCSSFCTLETLCGNGQVDPQESCDDGNINNGDGCSSTCRLESQCGNGILDANEDCDDGNRFNGDGCSDLCQYEQDTVEALDDFYNVPVNGTLTTSGQATGVSPYPNSSH